MQGDAGIYLRIFQYSGLQHSFGSGKALFIRLKHQLYRPFQKMLVLAEQLCCTKKHCSMHIVAAGMHTTIFRTERYLRFFCDSQCVHIRPQKQRFSGNRTADGGGDSAVADFLRFITVFPQLFHYKFGGTGQMGSGLRKLMNRSSYFCDFFFLFLGRCQDLFHNRHRKTSFFLLL